ncbi:MAG: hypothetical protein KAI24_21790 [Planctomycetes bacterium]|nr:hypothetical protein [Planctomycetota bacterium]
MADELRRSGDLPDSAGWRELVRADLIDLESLRAMVVQADASVRAAADPVIELVEPIADVVEQAVEAGEPIPSALEGTCTVYQGRSLDELAVVASRLSDGPLVRRPLANDGWLGCWIDPAKVGGLQRAWQALDHAKQERIRAYRAFWARVKR